LHVQNYAVSKHAQQKDGQEYMKFHSCRGVAYRQPHSSDGDANACQTHKQQWRAQLRQLRQAHHLLLHLQAMFFVSFLRHSRSGKERKEKRHSSLTHLELCNSFHTGSASRTNEKSQYHWVGGLYLYGVLEAQCTLLQPECASNA